MEPPEPVPEILLRLFADDPAQRRDPTWEPYEKALEVLRGLLEGGRRGELLEALAGWMTDPPRFGLLWRGDRLEVLDEWADEREPFLRYSWPAVEIAADLGLRELLPLVDRVCERAAGLPWASPEYAKWVCGQIERNRQRLQAS